MYNTSKTQFLKAYKDECNSKDEIYALYKHLIDKSKDFNIRGTYNYTHDKSYDYKSFEAKFTATDFDKDKMNDVPYSCLVYTTSYEYTIKFVEHNNSSQIEILLYKYNAVYYSASDKKHFLQKSSNNDSRIIKLIIFDNLSIYRENIKGKLIPCDLRHISYLVSKTSTTTFENCIFHILDFFSHKYVLFKDIINELREGPIPIAIPIKDIFLYTNKKSLIEAHCAGLVLPKKFNSFKLHFGYILAKSKRYVNEEDWQKLYIAKDAFDGSINGYLMNLSVYEQIQKLFKIYYKLSLTKEDAVARDYIIDDYVYMTWKYKSPKKFNLKLKSYKALIRDHDNLVLTLNNKRLPGVKIPKNSVFNNVKLPENFERIKTKNRLLMETHMQKHCVASYAELINKDKCSIYSTVYNNKRYTIEIRKRRKKFYIAQIKGMFNSDAPTELIELINSELNN